MNVDEPLRERAITLLEVGTDPGRVFLGLVSSGAGHEAAATTP